MNLPPAAVPGRLNSRPRLSEVIPVEPGVHTVSDAGARDGLLLVPPGAPRPRPLLVFFHGAGGVAAGSLPLVQNAATVHNVLVLLPSSAATSWDLIVGKLGSDVAALDAGLAQVFA